MEPWQFSVNKLLLFFPHEDMECIALVGNSSFHSVQKSSLRHLHSTVLHVFTYVEGRAEARVICV